MKIKVFLPNGATEIDNINVLISMVKSGVIQSDTVIEAKGRRVVAADIQEIKPVLEELEQAKKKEKAESPEANALRNDIADCQKRLAYATAARATIRQFPIAALVIIFLYAFPLACVVLDEMVKLSDVSTSLNRLEAPLVGLLKMGYYANKFSVFVSLLSAIFIWVARKFAVVCIDKTIFEYQEKEKELAKRLREFLQ